MVLILRVQGGVLVFRCGTPGQAPGWTDFLGKSSAELSEIAKNTDTASGFCCTRIVPELCIYLSIPKDLPARNTRRSGLCRTCSARPAC